MVASAGRQERKSSQSLEGYCETAGLLILSAVLSGELNISLYVINRKANIWRVFDGFLMYAYHGERRLGNEYSIISLKSIIDIIVPCFVVFLGASHLGEMCIHHQHCACLV